ncbi:hypothetical protein AMST5_00720 [freshwater sediment metagenome]|uniref:Uncharacterized protein n=1 Tax=freshwater sediment metagenome TaxID=556182 RepID=A0AA48LZK2_9ZZZZ
MSTDEALSDDGVCTTEQAAVIDFEALTAEELEICRPPSNEEWVRIFKNHLPALRIAWTILGMSKSDLVEMLRKIDDEPGVAMVDGLESAARSLSEKSSILVARQRRV